MKDNFVFYENFSNLTINIPKFEKNINEYKELNEIQLIAEKNLSIKIDNLNLIEEIINLLENIQDECLSKKIFIQFHILILDFLMQILQHHLNYICLENPADLIY